MEKDKSRGIKHIKDKRKYKGNTVKNVKYVPPKNKPNLGTNWDRYNSDEENEHEHKLSSSTDFSLLSNIPISTGSHFQFKNDKFEKEHDPEKVNLFCLDLDLLHKSILTIPFYERLGIDENYFKEHEIDTMDKEAKKHLTDYNKFMKTKNLQEAVILEESTNINELSKEPPDSLKNTSSDEKDDIIKLIDSCNIDNYYSKAAAESNLQPTTESKTDVEDNSKEDLEQWLDDILED